MTMSTDSRCTDIELGDHLTIANEIPCTTSPCFPRKIHGTKPEEKRLTSSLRTSLKGTTNVVPEYLEVSGVWMGPYEVMKIT
jgi:hypothetical protein